MLDEGMMTGESIPVSKSAYDSVSFNKINTNINSNTIDQQKCFSFQQS